MTDAELAYIAGIFDGEGCINFSTQKGTVYVRVIVSNTDYRIIQHLSTSFGGAIVKLKKVNEKWKDSWQWILAWSAAVDFLEQISPWLIIKQHQAQVVFAYDAIRSKMKKKWEDGKKEEYLEAINLLQEEMTFLNKKGPNVDKGPLDLYLEKLNASHTQLKPKSNLSEH